MSSSRLIIISVVLVALIAIAVYFVRPKPSLPHHKLEGFEDNTVRQIFDGFAIYNLNFKSLHNLVSQHHNDSSLPLADDVIIVTGATSGLGRSIAAHLLTLGAHVVVPVRRNKELVKEDLLKHADDILQREFGINPRTRSKTQNKVTVLDLDLSDLESVLSAVEVLESTLPRVTALVNNAGLINPQNSVSKQNFENTLAVNFLGPALLTKLLLSSPLTSLESRNNEKNANFPSKFKIISVTSEEHRGSEVLETDKSFSVLNSRFVQFGSMANSMDRYATSKLLQTTFFLSLINQNNEVNNPKDILVFDVCPGPVASSIASKNFDNFLGKLIEKLMTFIFQSPEHASLPFVKLLIDENMEKYSGEHFHMSKLKKAREDARSEKTQKWVNNELDVIFKPYLEFMEKKRMEKDVNVNN